MAGFEILVLGTSNTIDKLSISTQTRCEHCPAISFENTVGLNGINNIFSIQELKTGN